MIYYKIKPEFDQKRIKDDRFLIRNELFTKKEAERLSIPEKVYDVVSIPKSKIYWCFGARFEYLIK